MILWMQKNRAITNVSRWKKEMGEGDLKSFKSDLEFHGNMVKSELSLNIEILQSICLLEKGTFICQEDFWDHRVHLIEKILDFEKG